MPNLTPTYVLLALAELSGRLDAVEVAPAREAEALRTLAARCDALERQLAQLRSEVSHLLPAAGVRVVER
jgi:uncharacterized protein (DUF58 family)